MLVCSVCLFGCAGGRVWPLRSVHGKRRSSKVFFLWGGGSEDGGTRGFGDVQSPAVRHRRFTGPCPPAPLRTKAATKHTDESQMSRQGSKKLSRPQRKRVGNTHATPDDCSHAAEEGREEEGGEFLCVGKQGYVGGSRAPLDT